MRKSILLILGHLLLLHSNVVKSQCFIQCSSGALHCLALKDDSTLYSWGINSLGELGNGISNVDVESPSIADTNKWKMISAGAFFSLGLKSDGTIWAWGDNTYGQCGDSMQTSLIYSPLKIGSDNDWDYISSSRNGRMCYAIKTNGTLWAWGNNGGNMISLLGLGTYEPIVYIPKQVGTDANWKQISSADYHTLAIKIDGTLWSWGANSGGCLGTSNLNSHYTPIQIGTDINWKQVSAAAPYNSYAIKTDGTIWAWGDNTWGQLGNDTSCICNNSTPLKIGLNNDWKFIEGVQYYTFGIKSNNDLFVWGFNPVNGINLLDTLPILNSPKILTPTFIGNYNFESLNANQHLGSNGGNMTSISLQGDLWNWGGGAAIINDTFKIHDAIYKVNCAFPSDIISIEINDLIRISPNPTSSMINITSNIVDSYFVTDAIGKIVLKGSKTNSIDVSTLVKSTYILHYRINKNNYQTKFIKY